MKSIPLTRSYCYVSTNLSLVDRSLCIGLDYIVCPYKPEFRDQLFHFCRPTSTSLIFVRDITKHDLQQAEALRSLSLLRHERIPLWHSIIGVHAATTCTR